MTALIIIGIVLCAILLLGQIRCGYFIEYSEAGLFMALKAGPAKIKLYPSEGKKTKKKKSSDAALAEKKGKKGSVRDTVATAKEFFPLIGETAGRFHRKIRIDDLFLNIVWGNPDIAAAAMGYGAASAVMGFIWPIIEHNFRVKQHELHVNVDFERSNPVLELRAFVSMTFGQFLTFVLRVAIKALKIYLGIRKDQSQEEAV